MNIIDRFRPNGSVTKPENTLPNGCVMKAMLANHVVSLAVNRNVSFGFISELKPVTAGIRMVGNAIIAPKFQIREFFAEHAKT